MITSTDFVYTGTITPKKKNVSSYKRKNNKSRSKNKVIASTKYKIVNSSFVKNGK